jgi:hypothetical protein
MRLTTFFSFPPTISKSVKPFFYIPTVLGIRMLWIFKFGAFLIRIGIRILPSSRILRIFCSYFFGNLIFFVCFLIRICFAYYGADKNMQIVIITKYQLGIVLSVCFLYPGPHRDKSWIRIRIDTSADP